MLCARAQIGGDWWDQAGLAGLARWRAPSRKLLQHHQLCNHIHIFVLNIIINNTIIINTWASSSSLSIKVDHVAYCSFTINHLALAMVKEEGVTFKISSFSYYFDWRPSLGVKERHPQTWPNPTHGPNGPRCDRGQGWNLRAARVTHCGPIRYQRRTEGKLFHDIYVETSPAPLTVILFFFQEYKICVFFISFSIDDNVWRRKKGS